MAGIVVCVRAAEPRVEPIVSARLAGLPQPTMRHLLNMLLGSPARDFTSALRFRLAIQLVNVVFLDLWPPAWADREPA
jgi:hypothetical protein